MRLQREQQQQQKLEQQSAQQRQQQFRKSTQRYHEELPNQSPLMAPLKILPSGGGHSVHPINSGHGNSNSQGPVPMAQREREKSFVGYFGAGVNATSSGTINRPGRLPDHNQIQVNVNPTSISSAGALNGSNGAGANNHDGDAPEIRKYKKKFSGEILCAALWGVNLLVGSDSGLMLLDRSGEGKVYFLINRRRFDQMTVLEGQNILVTISGKKRQFAFIICRG